MVKAIEGGETLLDNAADNFAGANKDLKAAFGFGMRVLTPYGGGRTLDQQKHLMKIGLTNTLNSDHVKYVAVDIDNQRNFRNINQAKFLAILKAWGWRNVTNTGQPFPQEPWHFVNDNKKRINTDPNPLYQVYYCTTGGPKEKGYWYKVGQGQWWKTRWAAKKNYWIKKVGYGGHRTFAQIAAIKASGKSA